MYVVAMKQSCLCLSKAKSHLNKNTCGIGSLTEISGDGFEMVCKMKGINRREGQS